MDKLHQPDKAPFWEYIAAMVVLLVPGFILLAPVTNSAIGIVATVPTRTPTATPASSAFLPLLVNGPIQNYPPPFFNMMLGFPSYLHTDDLDCNSYRVDGLIFDIAENYWTDQTLTVHISANGFDQVIPITVPQDYSTPAWQVDLPATASNFIVQLRKRNDMPASPAYKLAPNKDCFWNITQVWFKQAY